jgi:hypothetical protein
MRQMIRIVAWCIPALALVFAMAPRPVEAGNGTYDKDKKAFHLNYIYASLPSNDLQENDILSSPSARPTDAQTRQVSAFLKQVSDTLNQVTGGRAQIDGITEVLDIEKADVVISLTGSVTGAGAGGAWATLEGWGQTGQLNLYYQDLAQEDNTQIVLTVTHELCHYFFGLPDEYPTTLDPNGNCPTNSGADRCLMDNFHLGWSGKLCSHANHNVNAPGANGIQPIHPRGTSCQELVDQFFAKLGVGPSAGGGGAVMASGGTATPTITPKLLSGFAQTVRDQARAKLKEILAHRPTGQPTDQDRQTIQGLIAAGLAKLLTQSGLSQPTGLNFTGLVENLVSQVLLDTIGTPPALAKIETLLRAQAQKLAAQITAPLGKENLVANELIKLATTQLAPGGVPEGAPPVLGPDDLAFLRGLARQAAAGQGTTKPESRDQLLVELQREMYDTIVALANQMHVPGAVVRNENMDRILTGLVQTGALPNRSLGSRFGRRKTVIIDPPVLVESLSKYGIDNAETQGFDAQHADYNIIREQSVYEFSKLIDRNQITALAITSRSKDEEAGPIRVGLTPLNPVAVQKVIDFDRSEAQKALVEGAVDPGRAEAVLEQRRQRLGDILDVVTDEIERNQLENIAVLVPPGGLPPDFGESLLPLRQQFIGKTDLRLDLALVGFAYIPPELRDLVTRTQGMILTVTDIDEVGAVAQRLTGEQTQGTWVSIPQQDYLLINQAQANWVPQWENEGGERLFHRLRGNRRMHKIQTADPVDTQHVDKVVLQPFYADVATECELIIGLTQPLTIAGVTRQDPNNLTSPPIPRSTENLKNFPWPELKLIPGEIRDSNQIEAAEADGAQLVFAPTPNLVFEPNRSTDTILVFRLPATSQGGVSQGWYTPVLRLHDGNFHDYDNSMKSVGHLHSYRNHAIHFTFSVGTPQSKAQLIADLAQDPTKDPSIPYQGTIAPNETEAIITAQLIVGAPVIQAEVFGYVQRIDQGTDPISTDLITFRDDGQTPDKQANDGVYAASIPLPQRRDRDAEYRVLIEGRSVANQTKFVPQAEPILAATLASLQGTADSNAVPQQVQNRAAPAFQRATSLEFYVQANTPRIQGAGDAGAAQQPAAAGTSKPASSPDPSKLAPGPTLPPPAPSTTPLAKPSAGETKPASPGPRT